MKIFPSLDDEGTSTRQESNSGQRSSSQLRRIHASKSSRILMPFYNPPSIESRITLSRSDSHSKFGLIPQTQIQRRHPKKELHKFTRKLIHALNFVKELRSYAEQLRSQHMEYKYRHRNILPLYPDDASYIIWIIFMNFLHFVASFVLPFQIAFQVQFTEQQGVGFLVIQLISLLFIMDIVFNLISCHVDENNQLLYTFDKIVPYYLKSWFIFDLLSIIPFEDYETTQYLSLVRMFRIAKYFMYERKENYNMADEIIRKKEAVVNEDLQLHESWNLDMRIRRMMTIFSDMIILTHIFACLWFWSAKLDNYNANTWVIRESIINEGLWQQYLESWYWAIQTVTVIGYGDIPARTNSEFFLEILWMLVGVGFYSFTIGDITCILANSNPLQEYVDQMKLIEELADSTFMIDEVFNELLNFVHFNINYNPFWARNAVAMMQEFPFTIQQYIIAATHKDTLKIIPFIANDVNFATMILPYCTVAQYEECSTIYHIGQSASDFYFLLSGDVRLSDSSGETLIRVMEGTVFGEIESIEQTLRRWHAHCVTKSIVLMCPGRFFERLIKENSTQFFELYQMYKRRKILLQDYTKQKSRSAVRIKRSTAIIVEGRVIKTQQNRRSSENRQQFKSKIDCRNYISVQQDLMLSVVGQKQARKKVLHEKFRLAVDRIKQMIIRSQKRRGALTADPDYKIMRDLIATRSTQVITTHMTEKNNYLQKLMNNFGKMVEQDNLVQSFIVKQKQESIDRIKRMKLKDMVKLWDKRKRSSTIRREIDLYYSQFHEQIYQELLQARTDQKMKLRQKNDAFSRNSMSKIKLLNVNLNFILQLSMKVSMHKFEILQLERDIDETIDDCQEVVQNIM